MAYGRTVLGTTGQTVQALFDAQDVIWKPGGITLDWSTVAAVGADTTLPDGTTVKSGEKYLRYGQVLALIGKSEVQTLEFTGGATAGDAIITLPASGDDAAQVAASVPFNATAAQVETALIALSRIGVSGVSVSRSGAGSAGSPYLFTITFAKRLGNVPQLTSTHTFTGGTSPSTTHATTTAGVSGGLYGPYDPAATDGRQNRARGDAFILNETVLQNPAVGWGAPDTDHPAVFDGGTVWKQRILATNGVASLANGMTFAEFEALFPRISYAAEI